MNASAVASPHLYLSSKSCPELSQISHQTPGKARPREALLVVPFANFEGGRGDLEGERVVVVGGLIVYSALLCFQ